jgi:hypothetical protein
LPRTKSGGLSVTEYGKIRRKFPIEVLKMF